jgi:hypothetical protein
MTDRLTALAVEIEEHVATSGWDQPPRLYALVPTAELIAADPALGAELGLSAEATPPGALTPVEQEDLPPGPLDEALPRIGWSADVAGCALVHEAVVLPPDVESTAPAEADEDALNAWASAHPDRRDVRLAVAVIRDGTRGAVVRVRADDGTQADDIVVDPDLAPGLADALVATLH